MIVLRQCDECGKQFQYECRRGMVSRFCPEHRTKKAYRLRYLRSLGLKDTPITEKMCEICGGKFTPKSIWNGVRNVFLKGQMARKTCYDCNPLNSRRYSGIKSPVPESELICYTCGKKFMGHKMKKYCSDPCREKMQKINREKSYQKRMEKKIEVCDKECHDFFERVMSIPDIPNTREQMSEEEEKRILDKAKDDFDMSNFVKLEASTNWMDEDGFPRGEFKKTFEKEFYNLQGEYPNWRYPHVWSAFILYRVEQISHIIRYEYTKTRNAELKRRELECTNRSQYDKKWNRRMAHIEAIYEICKYVRDKKEHHTKSQFFRDYLFKHPNWYGWKGTAKTYDGGYY